MGRWGFWLKLAISVGLLAAVVAVSHPARIAATLAQANGALVLGALAVWVAIQLLYVAKWHMLCRAQGLAVSFGKLLDVYYIGTFFNMFLPSGFGGDAVRAYELSKHSGRAGSSLAAVGMDRFTSLYALLLLGTGALLAAPEAWRVVPLEAVLALDVGGAVAFALLLHGAWLRRLAAWKGLARWPKVAAGLGEVVDAMAALRGAKGRVAVALAVSVLYQFLTVVLHHGLMLALGLPVAFGYAAVFVPILTLATSLPVSVNGLGIREGGFAYFLGQLGLPAEAGVSVGLLSLGMLVVSAAWGAVRYAQTRRPRPAAVLPTK